MTDKFFAGALAGMTGAVAMSALNFLLNLLPGINMELIFGVSKLFVPNSLAATLEGSIIGFIAHLACGSVLGFITIALMEKIGYNYLTIKGAILGLISWFLLCGIIGRLLDLPMQDKFLDNILFIIIHIVFGIVTVWTLYLLRSRELRVTSQE